jgi:cyclohexanecarboxyl-CoA dehydrogenase
MDFDFSEDQMLFRDSIRAHVEKELVPIYAERSKAEGLEATLFIAKKVAEWGLLGYGVPEAYGGQGIDLDSVTMGIVAEELGRGSNAWAVTWMEIAIWSMMLAKTAPEEMKKKYLPRMVKGDLFMPALFTEPHGGSDLSDVRVTAYPDGDFYVVNGAKASVTGGFGELMIVMARMVPETTGGAGVGLILVPGDLPGSSISSYKDWGMKEIARGDVFFDNVRVPKENVVAQPGKGFQAVMQDFDRFRPSLALMSVGCAERVIDECIKYSKSRLSFGKPLTKYEAISFGFAEHATYLEASKLLAYKALSLIDKGGKATKYASMAKWLGVESAINAIWFCTRTYGHLGFTSELDVMQHMLDVMGWAWGDGGWEIQKVVIAREIGGREMLPYDRK